MNVIVYSNLANSHKIVQCKQIPRIGDCIDFFYMPAPKVLNVVFWPSSETIRKITGHETLMDNIEAIVIVQ